MKEKWETVYELVRCEQPAPLRMTEKRRTVLSLLEERGRLRASELNTLGLSKDVLDRLAQTGFVAMRQERVSRDSFRDVTSNMNAICLNEDQLAAMARITVAGPVAQSPPAKTPGMLEKLPKRLALMTPRATGTPACWKWSVSMA